MWRRVIKATWGGVGVVQNERNWRSGTGRYWFMTLECGHEAIRPFRYFRCTGGVRFLFSDARPAPKRVKCGVCTQTSGTAETVGQPKMERTCHFCLPPSRVCPCGLFSRHKLTSADWGLVTCRACLRLRERVERAVKVINENIDRL